MKRILLVSAGVAVVLAFCLNHSRAQQLSNQPGFSPNHPVPLATPSSPNQSNSIPAPARAYQPPPQRPMMPLGTNQLRNSIVRSMGDLRSVKAQLQRSTGDLGGHKDSAIEACDKVVQELSAVLSALPVPPPPQQTMQLPPGAMAQPRTPGSPNTPTVPQAQAPPQP